MAHDKQEQQRRKEQKQSAERRQNSGEEEQKILPQKQAMSHLGQEKQGSGRQAPIKSKTPGNSRGRK